MFVPFPWLWLLGAGIALVVGAIAFLVAAGLVDDRASASEPEHERSARGPSSIRRAS
jgi:hypothetical protein